LAKIIIRRPTEIPRGRIETTNASTFYADTNALVSHPEALVAIRTIVAAASCERQIMGIGIVADLVSVVMVSLWFLSAATAEEAPETVDPTDYVIPIMTIICAFCLSSIGIVVASYANLEEQLFRSYLRNGVVVPAKVIATDAVRGRRLQTEECCSQQQPTEPELEYVSVVRYDYKKQEHENDFYTTAVQKQVTALGGDYYVTQFYEPQIKIHIDLCDMSDRRQGVSDSAEQFERQIDLLVYPNFPRSGVPRRQIQRSLEWEYRIPTYAFSVGMITAALLFSYLGIVSLPNFVSMPTDQFCNKLLILSTLVLLPLVLSQLFLRSWMLNMMQDEFLGDVAAVLESDQSLFTISTKGSFVASPNSVSRSSFATVQLATSSL
jgi:hypothetical protein